MTRLGDGPLDASLHELVATADETRRMDADAITTWGVSGLVLMELAGAAAVRAIRLRLGGVAGKAVVLCGPGNNGGDGYVVARHLAAAGFAVKTLALGEPKPGTDAETNHAIWQRLLAHDAAGPAHHEHRVAERGATARMRHFIGHANVVVDALFGTGLTRPLDGTAAELIDVANAAEHGLKVALDLPSGLDATTGRTWGAAFRADLTVTFGIAKRGLLLGDGPNVAGELEVVAIWPRPAIDAVGTTLRRATERAMARLVPTRELAGHKGTFGHVALLGGARSMEGAAVLAARGAARSGVGLTTWGAPRGGGPLEVERPPELMRIELGPGDALPNRADVLVCGPGLGRSDTARALFEAALADPRPLVLDADGLNLLAEQATTPSTLGALQGAQPLGLRSAWVLTPHPLEAARLLDIGVDDVQSDRVTAAEALATRFGAVVILKGARTLIAAPGETTVLIDVAEPTLAVGGSGDVLAGLVGGLIAQGLVPWSAAVLGAWVHAHAGREMGLGVGQRGAFASEIADRIPMVLHLLQRGPGHP